MERRLQLIWQVLHSRPSEISVIDLRNTILPILPLGCTRQAISDAPSHQKALRVKLIGSAQNRHQPGWPTQPSDPANHNISQNQQIPASPPRRTALSAANTNHGSTIGYRVKVRSRQRKLEYFPGPPGDRSALSRHIQRIYNKENGGAWYVVVGAGVIVVCSV